MRAADPPSDQRYHVWKAASADVCVCECVRVRERRPQRRLACLAESRAKERETGTRNGRNGHTDNTGGGPRGDPHTHSQTATLPYPPYERGPGGPINRINHLQTSLQARLGTV